jgi:hypothetical protein
MHEMQVICVVDVSKSQEVRQVTVDAVVDTGAGPLVITEAMRQKLELEIEKDDSVTLAGDVFQKCTIAEAVRIIWNDRFTLSFPLDTKRSWGHSAGRPGPARESGETLSGGHTRRQVGASGAPDTIGETERCQSPQSNEAPAGNAEGQCPRRLSNRMKRLFFISE